MNKIGVIGVGKLGLPYALIFEQAGFEVCASSYRRDYVEALNARTLQTTEPGVAELLQRSKNIKFTTDNHLVIDSSDIVYVMVATPSTSEGNYDVSAVQQVAQDYLDHPTDVSGKIMIVGSTVNPGDCQQFQIMLERRGVHVVYAPTFVAQGNVLEMIKDPRTLSIGTDNDVIAARCRDTFLKIVTQDTAIFHVSPTSAEILKLAGNARNTMLISFFNSIGQLLIREGLDRDLESASMYLNFVKEHVQWRFGFGYGGPCYPRDNRAMHHYAQRIGMQYPYATITDEFNDNHVDFLTTYLISMNPLGLPFYFRYISYKPGVAMLEESHQLQVCKNLLDQGATVYVEPSKFLTDVMIVDLTAQYCKTFLVESLHSLQDKNIDIIDVMSVV